MKIIEELEEFTSDLLGCIRDGHELTTILKKGAGKSLSRDKLTRIKLAVHYKHRKVLYNTLSFYFVKINIFRTLVSGRQVLLI